MYLIYNSSCLIINSVVAFDYVATKDYQILQKPFGSCQRVYYN